MEDQRNYCDETKGSTSMYTPLTKVSTIKWWEAIALYFIEEQEVVDNVERTTLVFKEWRGKTYILSHYRDALTGYNCRHSFSPIIPKKAVEIKSIQLKGHAHDALDYALVSMGLKSPVVSALSAVIDMDDVMKVMAELDSNRIDVLKKEVLTSKELNDNLIKVLGQNSNEGAACEQEAKEICNNP